VTGTTGSGTISGRFPLFPSLGCDSDFYSGLRRIDRRQFKHGNRTDFIAIVKAPGIAALGLWMVDQIKDFDDSVPCLSLTPLDFIFITGYSWFFIRP
jgi:hypothetical protein